MEVLETVAGNLSDFGFSQQQMDLAIQSKEAYAAAQDTERNARMLNGLIVSEPESDNSASYTELQDPFSEAGWTLIAARRKAVQRRKR